MECYVVWNTLTNNLRYNLSVSNQTDETFVAYVNCPAHLNVLPLWVPSDHFKFHDVVLSILGYHRDVRVIGQYVHIRGRYPYKT